ncbi:MAG: DUF4202 family protein [Candidatus Uhrbacteria bacterium]|nr:DUF4202 family protein [Candidatus Uhrbacteria bacterium]
MEATIYDKVEKFVFDSFSAAGRPNEMRHFVRTVYWLKVLLPDADEAFLVAALAHDIERAFRQEDVILRLTTAGFLDLEFLRFHVERGAEIVADFLWSQYVEDRYIERVVMLISRHEEGGSTEQNILRDADSISFLEVNAPAFFERHHDKLGIEKVRQKIDWMYSRISSEEARLIALPLYEDAVRGLDGRTAE